MKFLQKRLIEDDLGHYRFGLVINPIFIEKVFRDIDGASNWCDIKKNRETCPEIALNSLDEALFWLQENMEKFKCFEMGMPMKLSIAMKLWVTFPF